MYKRQFLEKVLSLNQYAVSSENIAKEDSEDHKLMFYNHAISKLLNGSDTREIRDMEEDKMSTASEINILSEISFLRLRTASKRIVL